MADLKWQFKGDDDFTYFFDTCLPFGPKSSPEIFQCLMQAVHWMMARCGSNSAGGLSWWFFGDCPPQHCQLVYCTLLILLQVLGFAIGWYKMVCLMQELVFLGIEVDTKKCMIGLPATKPSELHDVVCSFLTKNRANKQQLPGKLIWAGHVVYEGRTFLCLQHGEFHSFFHGSDSPLLTSTKTSYGSIPSRKSLMASVPSSALYPS